MLIQNSSQQSCLKLYNTCILSYLPVWVRLLGSLEDRCTEDRCFWSVVSTNAARYQMAPICSKWRGPEANGTTQTHCNSPVTLLDPFGAHCAYGRQHRCQEDPVNSPSRGLETYHEDAPASHGWAPYTAGSEIPQSHCLKQWIWPRTSLCGGSGRHTALCSLELCARKRWRRRMFAGCK